MNTCKITDEQIQLWLDNELSHGEHQDLQAEINACPDCQARAERFLETGRELRGLVDASLHNVEPLRAVQAIHQRIDHYRRSSWSKRMRARASDVWAGERRKVVSVMVAAAISAVMGPAVLYLAEQQSVRSVPALQSASPAMASVVVESLEFDGQSRAMIYRPAANTTVIWLESEDRHHEEKF